MRRAVDLILDWLCAGFMGAIVLTTLFQVTNRYALHYPVVWTDEAARFLAVWLIMLGAVRCIREDSHIQIDLLFNLFSPKLQRWIDLLANMIFVALVGVLIWQGFKILPLISTQTAAASRISMGWVYAAIPVSSLLMLFYLVERIIAAIRSPATPGDDHHRENESV